MKQTTIERAVRITGKGLHGGLPVAMTLQPAPAGTGILFRRTDVTGSDPLIPARHDRVSAATLCTLLTNEAGVTLRTVEHFMAAAAGCGLHNLLVEVDGPELPIMDGSAAPFVSEIARAGLRVLEAPLEVIRVLQPVEVREGDAVAMLEPYPGFSMRFTIDFEEAAIGRQSCALDLADGAFQNELGNCRTFCRRADIASMRANGLALGGSLENAIVVDGARVLNPGGLRRPDEYVRHKMLDAVGDLALAGRPLLARYRGHRAGHRLTNLLLRRLFETPEAFRTETCSAALAGRLPALVIGAARAVA